MADILIVDDDQAVCAAFAEFLVQEGHTARLASNAQDAIASVEAARPDLVILDIRMPGTDGLQVLERIRRIAPDVCVVMMTGYGTSQTSIEALRLGAYEYLTKPLDLDVLKSVIDQGLEAQALARRVRSEPAPEEGPYPLVNLVGRSAAMQQAYKLIGRLTTNDVPVLIVGERGAGKHLVARTIHFNSRRKEGPFVAVSAAALPADVLAEELFGRVAAGATPETTGKLDLGRGGTLLVADVHALPLALQARLLRLLTERTFERVGGRGSLAADLRVIAATDEDLADEVQQGSFNGELYDALRVITVEMPSLRERREDVPELVEHFVKRCSVELGKTIHGVDARALQLLTDHPWPGNVGELEHVLKRASILARGEVITADDLAGSLEDRPLPGREETDTALAAAVRRALQQRLAEKAPTGAWPPFHDIVGRAEKILVGEALAMTSGNQLRAAELLGLNRTTLRKKMRLYRLGR